MQQIEIIIKKLLWDDWNIAHIARHQVATEEVELALSDRFVVFLRAKMGRIMILGRANERLISAVLNEQETAGEFYVITARDMSKKEHAYYRANKQANGE